ncbi:MAG: M13 family metallopeptidase [Alphaproteobacteria bacterium]|nr:M13 family metallopeptidase [Alphaproteobacteria bacterium]
MRFILLTAIIMVMTTHSALANTEAWGIQFKRGEHGKTISSVIKGYDGADYSVKASDGQVLHILFSTKQGMCYMNVFEPGKPDEAVFIGSVAGNEFGASPAKGGTYKIQVYQMRAAARRGDTCKYEISFELTGNNSAALSKKPVLGTWGIETQNISKNIQPGDDFYRYVNEGWLKHAAPPPGIPYANSFIDAYLRTEAQLAEMMASIKSANFSEASDEYKLNALYSSFVNIEKRNALGVSPIKDDLDALLKVSTHEEAAKWMAKPLVSSFIAVHPATDEKNPQRYVLHAIQSGLGLPAAEFYTLTGHPYDGHQQAYRDYIQSIFDRAGIPDGKNRADSILALEKQIANIHWSPTEQRDPVKTYHKMTIDELQNYAPELPWKSYLSEAGYANQQEIVLMTDTSIQGLAKLFAATPVETLQSYLAFHYINSFAPVLSQEYQEANFAFFGVRLSGTPEQQSIENQALALIGKELGEILGRAYVQRFFPDDYKKKMDAMVYNLRAAFKSRLEANEWMDEPTRKEALAKLNAVVNRIGYPNKYRDYSSLVLQPDDIVGNLKAIAAYEKKDSLKKLNEKRRDWQWDYPASEINAGYDPSNNTITFPAGILQSPFFDPYADAAVNYASIGAVIGHELGHAFDDQGSQSDGTGALRNWWTGVARENFKKRTDILVEQFDHFSPIKGMNVNGHLTLGENIGDLGGLSIGYEAYQMHLAKEENGKAQVLDGFTGNQRFFLAWAQLWRDYTAPETMRQNLLRDPHSPSEFRANTVRNLDPWYDAFDVKEGDKMYLPPEKRVKIW